MSQDQATALQPGAWQQGKTLSQNNNNNNNNNNNKEKVGVYVAWVLHNTFSFFVWKEMLVIPSFS